MDRQSRIIVGGLVGVLLIAFVLVGPGRALAESLIDGDDPVMTADYDAETSNDRAVEAVQEPRVIRLDRPQLGTTSPDPLEGEIGASPPRAATASVTSRPVQRQGQASAQQREQRARDLSGLEDGDLSTTGDLAF